MNTLKVSILAALVTLATVSVFAAQSVYGNWKFPQVVAGPVLIDAYLTIAPNQVTTHSTCSMNGKSVSVEVTSPAQITDTQISILASAQKEVNEGGLNCNASVQVGSMNYVVAADGSSLTVSVPGQGSFILPRQ